MIGPPVEKLPDAIPKRRSSTSDLTRTPLKAQQTSALPLTPKNDTLKSSRKGKKRPLKKPQIFEWAGKYLLYLLLKIQKSSLYFDFL